MTHLLQSSSLAAIAFEGSGFPCSLQVGPPDVLQLRALLQRPLHEDDRLATIGDYDLYLLRTAG
jgi:hypothetical protein